MYYRHHLPPDDLSGDSTPRAPVSFAKLCCSFWQPLSIKTWLSNRNEIHSTFFYLALRAQASKLAPSLRAPYSGSPLVNCLARCASVEFRSHYARVSAGLELASFYPQVSAQ